MTCYGLQSFRPYFPPCLFVIKDAVHPW